MPIASCLTDADLERFFLGGLPEPEARAFDEHLLRCRLCLDKLKTVLTTSDTLAGLLREDSRVQGVASSSLLPDLMKQLKALHPSLAGSSRPGDAMLPLTCTGCGKKLAVKEALIGKKVKCPSCGQILAVPVPAAASIAAANESAASPICHPAGLPPLGAAANHPAQGSATAPETSCDTHKDHDRVDDNLTEFLLPPQTADELGRLGKYRILKILGHGGMGVVFQAEDPQLKRLVAVKAMLPDMARRASAGQRFRREAQTMAAVKHDHVATIHEVNEERGVSFLVMEFLIGESLDDRLKREKQLPIREVLRVGREIAEGLDAAHQIGLIHRDVKPANIWLEAPRGRVKLLDFGLARSVQPEVGLTQQGAIVGTPSFMAPEQARGDTVDARADLFSLGVILFQMTTGKLPFRGKDPLSILFAISNDAPPSPPSLNPNMPPELSDLIMKLLEKKTERRFGKAQHVATALEAIHTRYFAGRADHPVARSEATDRTEKEIVAQLFSFDSASAKVVSLQSVPKSQAQAAPAPWRRSISWKWLAAGICAAVAIFFAAQIVIRIRHGDGSETRIEAPKDSTVIVEEKGKPALKVPSGKRKAKAAAGEPHRRVAEMMLNHGGALTVWTDKGMTEVAAKNDLPKEPFLIFNVKGGNTPIPGDALAAFEGVYYIPHITLTLADTAGLRHLRGVSVEKLGLDGQHLNGDECLTLLGERPELGNLGIRFSSVSDVSIPLLLKMKRLRGLSLQGSKLTEAGIKGLASHPSLGAIVIDPIDPLAAVHLNRLPYLRHMQLSVGDDAAVGPLSALTRIASLDPGWNLSDEGARRLQKALPNAAIIHKGVPPTEAERSAVQWVLDRKASVSFEFPWGQWLKEVPKQAFSLGPIHFPDDAAKTGAVHLRGIRCVTELSWFGLDNADEEAVHIATLGTLRGLSLGRTKITAVGMERLTALKQLESLTLWSIPTVTAEGLNYLKKFEHLGRIGFNACPITDNGLAQLANVNGLSSLTLHSCGKFTDAGLKQLASLPLLQDLQLNGCELDEKAVGALKLLARLRVLDVRKTRIVAADVAELHKALPRCAIFWDGGLVLPGAETDPSSKQP